MERKAGRVSIAGGCLGGSLTGVLGSENPLPYLIVIEFFKDPSSSHKKKYFTVFATYLDNSSQFVLQSAKSIPSFQPDSRL